jgi:small subunit ribosomal protein S1
MVSAFLVGGDNLNELNFRELLRSKEEKRIITGKITGIEDEYYKIKNEKIPCAIVWYEDIKVLIPISHLGISKQTKSMLRGMLGSEIDFIVMEIDETTNLAIASRIDAMNLRAKLELPKLKLNDNIKVRVIAVGIKHIIVEMYGKEVIIKAENLQHTYIVNCKDIYTPGDYLKVKIKTLDIENNIFELDAKCFLTNPYKSIRKFITEYGEYTGKVIAFPKKNSGIIIQLDQSNISCLVRVPARFNNYPHYMQNVLIKVTEINETKKLIYGYLMRVF